MTTSTGTPSDGGTQFGVLFFEGCDELDAIGPANLFFAIEATRAYIDAIPPTRVHLIAETMDPIRSGNGVVLQPSTDYAACPPLDVLVVAGGSGGPGEPGGRLREIHNEATLAFIRQAAARDGAIVASVCTGSFLLAGAGLLAGRRANTHWLMRDELCRLMAERDEAFELVPERIVDDGDVVTSGGVTSGIDLAVHLIGRVLGDQAAGAVALGVERETPGSRDEALASVSGSR